ncbi:hypothetical protein ZOSMA_108G00120 [Zostera marina]|uniref:Uncharacterized protein n=1 Tax=Zostera marina TaxID=29655 RepID=A0A0K9Q468_ZOSMR|nr:hypothetical protein ZOSMA_108G00120 [Zostera marina]
MSSLSIRRSPSLNSVAMLGKCRLTSPSSVTVVPLSPTSSPIASVDVAIVSSKVSFTHGGGRPPTPDPWLERSALLCRLLSDYTPTEIGALAIITPSRNGTGCSSLPHSRSLRTMEDVIADVSHSRVLTHTFFPTEAAPRSLLSGPVPPLMSSIVTTPPVESYFTPLSMLPNVHTSMPVPPFMHSALFAGRLYRSLGLQTRSKISLTLTHSRVWRSGLFPKRSTFLTLKTSLPIDSSPAGFLIALHTLLREHLRRCDL